MKEELKKETNSLRNPKYANDRRIIQYYREQQSFIEKLFQDRKHELYNFIKEGIKNKKPISFRILQWEIENHTEQIKKIIDRVLMNAYDDDDSWSCIHKEFHDMGIEHMTNEFHYELCKIQCFYYELKDFNILEDVDARFLKSL